MPSVFGLTHLLFSSPQVSLFGAFGSFALLLLVDFPGRPRARLVSYVALFFVGGCFVALGTVVSTNKVASVAAMAAVGFAVLLAGIVSPQAATASTAAIVTFVLPVAVAQPAAAIGPRLVGWALAGAFCIPACMLVWPTPWHDNLRRRLSATVSALGQLAAARAERRLDHEAQAAVKSELSLLRDQFAGTPYPPTGTAAGAVALAKLVGRVEWVAGNAALLPNEAASLELSRVRAVIAAVAETLRLSALLICDGKAHPVDDPALVQTLQESARRLDQLIVTEIDVEVSTLIDPDASPVTKALGGGTGPETIGHRGGIAFSLDPSFHARALGIATNMVADAALEAAGAQPVGGGPGDAGEGSSLLVGRRLASHLSFRSVWFRNAVRGAAGLALAVGVVEVTDVEHGFWVVLGTLSVLRSNALGTGATALRAIGGTAVGVVVGSAIMIGVAGHSAWLWVLLPLAVLVSGVAPSMISFAAGQAGFTVVVVVLFNIIQPTGWRVGLTRIEDVAIGCAVSVVVGLLFWPRGATAALGRALSDAFVESSGYLADAVDRLTTTTREVDTGPSERAANRAYLRLDDAFRQLLAERGAKVVPIETVANLFTGTNRIRLAAYTLATLPALVPEPGERELESVAIAGAVLRDSYASSHRWYEEFADLLADRRDSLDPPPVHDETLHGVLREAFEDARSRRRSDRLRFTLRMLWADELLETQRQVQAELAGSADLFVRRQRQGLMI
jgi:uncharacterized membrane protein YccC